MTLRKLQLGLTLSALTLLGGCTTTTSNRQPYGQPAIQPAIVQTTPVTTTPYTQAPPIRVQTSAPPPPGVYVQPGPGAPPCPNCAPGQPTPPVPVLPR